MHLTQRYGRYGNGEGVDLMVVKFELCYKLILEAALKPNGKFSVEIQQNSI